MKLVTGGFGGLFKVLLRGGKRGLGDLFLGGDCGSIVLFGLQNGALGGIGHYFGGVSLINRYTADNYFAQCEYRGENYGSAAKGKLPLFVLFVALFGSFLLIFYFIKSAADNRNSAFIMNVLGTLVLIVWGQVVFP
jgi:hypothetical protein